MILSAVNPDTLYIVENEFENGPLSRMEIVMVVGGSSVAAKIRVIWRNLKNNAPKSLAVAFDYWVDCMTCAVSRSTS